MMVDLSKKFYYFQPTHHDRKWYYAVFNLLLLGSYVAIVYRLSSNNLSVPTDFQVIIQAGLVLYTILFSATAFWLRWRGAPRLVMLSAIIYNCWLSVWMIQSWLVYEPGVLVKPIILLFFLCGFLPVLVFLSFIRSYKYIKNELRKSAIAKRKAISPTDRAAWSMVTSQRLFDMIKENTQPDQGCVAVYSALSSELSLESLVLLLGDAGYSVAYPAIIAPGLMEFYTTVGSGELDLHSVSLIADPMSTKTSETLGQLRKLNPDQLSVVIVPGVAFDQDCYRLGFGGGFYDRYLPRLPEQTWTVGVCFDQQIYPAIPVQRHDRRLDAVVTPEFSYHSEQR